MTEVSRSFQTEVQQKQTEIDTLRASLRTTSTQLNTAKQNLETLQVATKAQSLARQKTYNLSRAKEEEQVRLARLESSHGPLTPAATVWETQLVLSNSSTANGSDGSASDSSSAAVLRARIHALRQRADQTKKAVSSLQGRSKDVELKYRKVLTLCTGVPELEVDDKIDVLLKAVESERGDLEIGRVRRFLEGVEGTVR
jgi:regulatory protein SWI6